MGPVSSTSNLSPTFPALNFSSASGPAAKGTIQPSRHRFPPLETYPDNRDYNQFLYNHFNY